MEASKPGNKRAIIVGHTGQDGYYLYHLLSNQGYRLLGISSNAIHDSSGEIWRPIDVRNVEQVSHAIRSFRPNEIYYLAAVHHSSIDKPGESNILFNQSIDINLRALINFLEGIKSHSQESRLFYAASSHIFGNPQEEIQSEETPINPVCIYGITKTAGLQACRFYRNNHKIFASTGILYNHESPRRSSRFVTKKIVETAVEISQNRTDYLTLGDLKAKIDWGYAPDYVEAMHSILQSDTADDLIISSGNIHTVKDFVEETFDSLGLDWKKYVKEDYNLITKKRRSILQGDHNKITNLTGWKPKTGFKEMIQIMVNAELKKYEQ